MGEGKNSEAGKLDLMRYSEVGLMLAALFHLDTSDIISEMVGHPMY